MQPATPDARPADAPADDEDIGPELEGEEFAGMGMVAAIAGGLVPSPGVLDWNAWQRWRARSGTRPALPSRRDARFPPFQRRELDLWRATTQQALAMASGAGPEEADLGLAPAVKRQLLSRPMIEHA